MFIHLVLATMLLSGIAERPLDNPAVQIARTQFEAGNYTEVIARLNGLQDLALDPDIWYWLGRSYYEKGNYADAVMYLEKASEASPQNAEYQRWLGRAYGGQAERSHSFILARKVRKAFETAVSIDPNNINARRDFMQYLVEAPWIVGGDKDRAKQQVDAIARLDPLQGRLARAAFLSTEKRWKEAELEYLAAIDQHSVEIGPYLEAAEFFAARRDANNLDRAIRAAEATRLLDPHLDFYRAVVLVLRRTDVTAAESLLHRYIDNVPERSDYPSHNVARYWLQMAQTPSRVNRN
jgi:tetratricopeptide (TPR) repeat protein